MPLPIKASEEGIQFPITVQPKSSRNELSGIYNNTLKVKITSAPVDGAANKTVQKYLAKQFCVSQSQVSILSGTNNRRKLIQISSINEQVFQDKINTLLT